MMTKTNICCKHLRFVYWNRTYTISFIAMFIVTHNYKFKSKVSHIGTEDTSVCQYAANKNITMCKNTIKVFLYD